MTAEEQLHLPGMDILIDVSDPGWQIKPATLANRGHFLYLWKRYMEESAEQGSHVLANDSNLREFLYIFESYCAGSMFGVVEMAWGPSSKPLGITMAGEYPGGPRLETTLGRTAIVWGVYVDPEYRQSGMATSLTDAGALNLLKQNFDSIYSDVLAGNEAGLANAKSNGTVIRAHSISRALSLEGKSI